MKFLLVLALTATLCSGAVVQFQPDFNLVPEPVSVEDTDFQERSLLSTLKTAASLVSAASNNTLSENLKTAAGVVADVALTAVTGTDTGAALAKTAIGVVGEVISAASEKLSDSSLANNTLAQAILNSTEDLGELLSDYGGGNATVTSVVSLVKSVKAGNITLKTALKTAGVYLIDSTLTPTKEKFTIAGKALELVGGVVETMANYTSDAANSTTEEVLEEILEKIGALSALNATITFVDNTLNMTIEETISEKLAELDTSTATLKEKVVVVAEVLEKLGAALVTIGDTFVDLGDSSVADYKTIIEDALSELTSSSS